MTNVRPLYSFDDEPEKASGPNFIESIPDGQPINQFGPWKVGMLIREIHDTERPLGVSDRCRVAHIIRKWDGMVVMGYIGVDRHSIGWRVLAWEDGTTIPSEPGEIL